MTYTEELDRCRAALKFAIDGYDRIDIGHEEYRVQVYMAALDALGEPQRYECAHCNDTGRRQYGADAMETEPCGCRADLDAGAESPATPILRDYIMDQKHRYQSVNLNFDQADLVIKLIDRVVDIEIDRATGVSRLRYHTPVSRSFCCDVTASVLCSDCPRAAPSPS